MLRRLNLVASRLGARAGCHRGAPYTPRCLAQPGPPPHGVSPHAPLPSEMTRGCNVPCAGPSRPGAARSCETQIVSGVRQGYRLKETESDSVERGKEKRTLRSIELFTGAGGLALGTHVAGFKHVALLDWNRDACTKGHGVTRFPCLSRTMTRTDQVREESLTASNDARRENTAPRGRPRKSTPTANRS